jgi:hypothetical protein
VQNALRTARRLAPVTVHRDADVDSARPGYIRPGASMTKLRGDSRTEESTSMRLPLSQKEAGAYYTPDPVVSKHLARILGRVYQHHGNRFVAAHVVRPMVRKSGPLGWAAIPPPTNG